MLSGIGLVDYLVVFNIIIIFDNFVVGLNMVDNLINFMWVFINQVVEVFLIQVVGIISWGSFIEILSGQVEVLIVVIERDFVVDNFIFIGLRSFWGCSDLNYDIFIV